MILKRGQETIEIKTGYSWKSLLFGVFYPLFIGDSYGAFVQFCISSCTFGLSWLITPFHYNSNRLKRLIDNGWVKI